MGKPAQSQRRTSDQESGSGSSSGSSGRARLTRTEWCVLPDRLLACIHQRRREDGYQAWSYESIGAHVGCTGAAIGKICRGQTRQPRIELVDRLAALLGVDRRLFTAGALPQTTPSGHHDHEHPWVGLDWLDPCLLAGLDHVTDPTTQAILNHGIRSYITTAREQPPAPSQTPPPSTSPFIAASAGRHSGPAAEPWRINPERLNDAIRRFAAHHPPHAYSNATIGDKIGLSETSVIRIRHGHVKQPDLVALHRLAALLRTSLDEITTGTAPRIAPTTDAHHAAHHIPVIWLSDDNRLGLALMTDPGRRTTIQRGIRLLLEQDALNQISPRHTAPGHS